MDEQPALVSEWMDHGIFFNYLNEHPEASALYMVRGMVAPVACKDYNEDV